MGLGYSHQRETTVHEVEPYITLYLIEGNYILTNHVKGLIYYRLRIFAT